MGRLGMDDDDMSFKDFADGFTNVVNVFGDDSFDRVILKARTTDAVANAWTMVGQSLSASMEDVSREQKDKAEPTPKARKG